MGLSLLKTESVKFLLGAVCAHFLCSNSGLFPEPH